MEKAPSQSLPNSAALSDGVDFHGLMQILIEKAWLILLCVVAAGFLGEAQISRTPKTYQAKAVLEIASDDKKVVDFGYSDNKDLGNQDVVQTIVDSFSRRQFLQRIVEEHKLTEDPMFRSPGSAPLSKEAATNVLSESFKVQLRHGTRLLDLTAEHQNPEMAAKIANLISTEFIEEGMSQRAANSQIATDFLLKKAEELKARLQKSEEALQAYKEKTPNAVSLEERQDTVVSKLKTQSAQLTDAKALRMRLESDYEAVRKLAGKPDALLEIGSVANYPTILETKQQIAAAESKISTLALRYTDKHPKMIQAKAQLAEYKSELSQNVLKIPPLIASAYETAKANEAKFATAQQQQEAQALDLNKQAISYNVLARDVETNRALYEAIVKRLKETDVAKGIELRNIQIFESASVPTWPAKPQKARILLLSLAAGLITGIGLSLALFAFDSSIKTVEQAESVTGLRVLGSIPRARRSFLKSGGCLMVEQPDSPASEHFRSLRTALQLLVKKGKSTGCKTLLFTSALPAEGKTFCSVNCAVAFAQQHLRTLLIDADLRSPSLDKLFFQSKRTPGLVEYLIGIGDPFATIHPTNVENLSVLPAGELASNPAELLSGPAFGRLILLLGERFDRIVIDTAPVIPISDTLLLVEAAQWVCFVARAGKTPRKVILRACELLNDAGTKPAGLVLNQVAERTGADAYYSGPYGEPYGGTKRKEAEEARAKKNSAEMESNSGDRVTASAANSKKTKELKS